ncbi:DUF262 domain-containing protein [Polaromonas sp. AET17H-212]|uniref:DUF262 domain-containing protein n=1 Tax=Polaromonas sp. AET17H-212 TaxID=1977061 RepID=UPI0015965426|nr:DUF262 domain-containing protein [Polaromonas sp. AET17H-212]
MSYKSETIAVAIERMNRQYFLPAIQREFVWKPEQIVELFDSIMRGYPISSFLFWDLKPQNRDKWQVYKFLERAVHGGTHNELANTDGANNVCLVLDGQQRLTSLMIGLRGTYVMKKKYKRRDNPEAWSPQRLHIDLFSDPNASVDSGDVGVYFKFEFMEQTPKPDEKNHWFRVGKILDFDEAAKFDSYLEAAEEALPDAVSKGQARIFRRNLERLYKAIHDDEVIAYYTEIDQDYDRVLDIFVRANEGGTKLSKSDLLLSMVTSSWDGVNAREEIFSFVDRVNSQLTKRNEFDKDFIMKSCLVVSDLPVVYKVEHFNERNLTLIKDNWPLIKRSVERGVDLTNSFGIDRDNLTSVNALIPIIYYLFKNPNVTLRGSTVFEARNAETIRRWLIMALLKGAFGRASDGLLKDIRACIKDQQHPGADFPVEEITAVFAKTGLSTVFDDFALDEILSRTYGQQQTFLALSLLYDGAAWGTMPFHQDHIFAQSAFKQRELLQQNRSDWYPKKDRLGNLCLLLAHENIGKQDMPLPDWLATREPDFLKRHLIPENPSLWEFDQFPEFLNEREKLIRRRIKTLFGQ